METFVVDTSVVLEDFEVINDLENAEVVIPLAVLQELDDHKRDLGVTGYNARSFIKLLEKLRQNASLSDGVPLGPSCSLKVETTEFPHPTADQRILALCERLQKEAKNKIFLLSEDISLRLLAEGKGVSAKSGMYMHDESLYRGVREIQVDKSELDLFFKNKQMPISSAYPNEYFIMRTATNGGAIGKYKQKAGCIIPLGDTEAVNDFVRARNANQRFLVDAILDPDISIVMAASRAGCGKTIIALGTALYLTRQTRDYQRVVITKAVTPVGGRDAIGYLPGSFDEKMRFWTLNFTDNLSVISNWESGGYGSDIFTAKDIEVCSLMHMRGRSLHHSIIILDEAQNISPKEAKTIVTRIGEGSKLIVLGDITQIDVPYLNEYNNGLTYMTNKFKDYDIAASVYLDKNERSKLSTLAAEIM
jgi:PhoH-like ATPase